MFVDIFTGSIGVARGCGLQKIGAFVNLASYYLVGLPSGLLLGFHFHVGGRVKLNLIHSYFRFFFSKLTN